ncbi:tkt [Symbiodinium sp. CCMP2592]|nr:tkt [Symbiodinium sp. CCMP2592]
MSRQRAIAANFDEELRCPLEMDGGRAEGGCVVCARRFWMNELFSMVLFQRPDEDASTIEVPAGAETLAPNQQHRLCRLLGVARYAERWPQIALSELKASAVEHPYIEGEFLLLHRRRMPASFTDPCTVCRDCRRSLKSSILTLPRHALANDLWIGRVLPELSNLSAGTKRLLPIVRVCMQVTVLQPLSLPRDERQKGYIGNTIFLPQAGPSAIQATLPPKDQDMAESILFVLVGQKKQELRSSKLLQAPREEYVAAVEKLRETSPYYRSVALEAGLTPGDDVDALEGCVLETAADSYLARELLQKGPADAQGQDEEGEPDEQNLDRGPGSSEDAVLRSPAAGVSNLEDAVLRSSVADPDPGRGAGSSEDAVLRSPAAGASNLEDAVLRSSVADPDPGRGAGGSEDAVLRSPAAGASNLEDAVLRSSGADSDSGHLVSSIVGLNDQSDDGNRWLRVCSDVEELCRRRPPQYYTDAESVLRSRVQNEVDPDRPHAVGLLGREGQQERAVLRRVQKVQSMAKGVEQERRAQKQMFEVRPQKLVVPSRDEPMNMFQPATWAMAFPELFPWGDGVPFVRRETGMEAGEVFRYLLLREELVYGDTIASPALPRWSMSVSWQCYIQDRVRS